MPAVSKAEVEARCADLEDQVRALEAERDLAIEARDDRERLLDEANARIDELEAEAPATPDAKVDEDLEEDVVDVGPVGIAQVSGQRLGLTRSPAAALAGVAWDAQEKAGLAAKGTSFVVVAVSDERLQDAVERVTRTLGGPA